MIDTFMNVVYEANADCQFLTISNISRHLFVKHSDEIREMLKKND